MTTTTISTDCLTYEELSSYISQKTDATRRAELYRHIVTCELCVCAVNGFSEIPFAQEDINDLTNKIDLKTHIKQNSSLTFAQVCIVLVSLFSIVAFYGLTSYIQRAETAAIKTIKIIPFAQLYIKSVANNTGGKITNDHDCQPFKMK